MKMEAWIWLVRVALGFLEVMRFHRELGLMGWIKGDSGGVQLVSMMGFCGDGFNEKGRDDGLGKRWHGDEKVLVQSRRTVSRSIFGFDTY